MAQGLVNNFLELAIQTIRDPKSAADRILGYGLDRNTAWIALFLGIILNSLLFYLTGEVMRMMSPGAVLQISPVGTTSILGASLVLSVYAVVYIGRFIGGHGTLDTILPLFAWLQFMRAALQAVMLVLSLLLPALSGLVFFVAVAWGVYIVSQFVARGHGFGSGLQGLLTIVIATVVLSFVLATAIYTVIGPELFGVMSNV